MHQNLASQIMAVSFHCILRSLPAGQYTPQRKAVWGEWSVESQYVTLGQAAAPVNAAVAEPAAAPAKKGRKKAAEKKGEKKTPAAQQTAFDEQAAIEQLKVCNTLVLACHHCYQSQQGFVGPIICLKSQTQSKHHYWENVLSDYIEYNIDEPNLHNYSQFKDH